VGLYLRALLGTHMSKLRASLRDSDRGASAIELAIITAVLVVLAIVVLAVIDTFVKSNASSITDTFNP
jgi:Flp pilus assembly protein TadG